jgi:outer membrane protein, heavy metal efflux system
MLILSLSKKSFYLTEVKVTNSHHTECLTPASPSGFFIGQDIHTQFIMLRGSGSECQTVGSTMRKLVLLLLCLSATPAFAQDTPPLSLTEAFSQADAQNPQLLAARRNLVLSQADITIAGAIPNPQIAAQYGFGSIFTEQGSSQQVGVSQTLELGGKLPARLGLANSNYRLTELQLSSLRWDVRSQVRRAYAELAAAEAQSRSVDLQISLVQRLVDIARKRFEAGAAPEAELLQAQLSRNQIDIQRTQALGRIQQARTQLTALLGSSFQQEIAVKDKGLFDLSIEKTELVPKPDVAIPTLDALLTQAYNQRLDLQATQQQQEVARQQLNLAQALRTPDLQVSAGYQFTTYTNGIPRADGIFVGAGITLPIFYNQNGEVARAQATIEQSTLQSNALRSQISANVRSSYQALAVARENIRKYQTQLIPNSRDVLNLAQESYQVGKTGLTSAILAQQADQQIRSGYLDAVVAYQSAWADLERAVGVPLAL